MTADLFTVMLVVHTRAPLGFRAIQEPASIRFLSEVILGEVLDDELATLLASRDNIRHPCGGLVRRTTIPAFHRKRSPFDV